jgi:hypothetical protein
VADRILGLLTPEILILKPGASDVVRNQLELAGWMPRPGFKRLPIGDTIEGGRIVPGGGVESRPGTRKRSRGSSANTRACSIPDCDRAHTARGLCATHYQQARRGKIAFPDGPT